MTSRRQARRDSMVILYQHELTGSSPEELFEALEKDEGRELDVFTREEVADVLARIPELDGVIDEYAEGWPAHRLAPLERNILRIAVYEMRNRDSIPVEVSIDEAVSLAKRFCSREAASLINGILGKLATEATEAAGDDGNEP